MKTSKVIIIKLLTIFFIFGCNTKHKKETPITNDLNTAQTSEKLNCDDFNFSKIQKNYSLYNVSKELSNDTSIYSAKMYFNRKVHFPNHGFLIVTNEKQDTILEYFGDVPIILNSYIFKKNNDFFIHLKERKYNQKYPGRFYKDNKFFQIDTIKQTIVEIEQLNKNIFRQFFNSNEGIQTNYRKIPDKNEFELTSYLRTNDTLYSVSCFLEFIKESNHTYKFTANPKDLIKISLKEQKIKESKNSYNITFGKINDYELIYDCYGCRTASTDRITVYAKKNSIKTKLFSYYNFGGGYLGEISLKYFDNHPFIYIHSTHTYGHSSGNLYALDIENLKANYVNKIEHNYKVPDSLYPRNFYGVDINKKGELVFGTWYRSDNVSGEYSLSGEYELIKVKENIYLLEPTDIKFWK